MKLVNKELAGKKLVSAHAMLEFDAEGVAVKPELSEDLMKAFAEIPGFEIVEEEKKQAPKQDPKPDADEKKQAPKQDPKPDADEKKQAPKQDPKPDADEKKPTAKEKREAKRAEKE